MKNEPETTKKEESAALKKIYLSKRDQLGLTQEKLSYELGITQGAVGHYLNGRNPLNVSIAIKLSKILDTPIDSFSPRLAAEALGAKKASTKELIKIADKLPDTEIEFLIKMARERVRLSFPDLEDD